MLKKLLGAAAMVALAYAVVPAQAAKMGGGCSSANLSKTESTIDTMAEGENKITAQKEGFTALQYFDVTLKGGAVKRTRRRNRRPRCTSMKRM